MGQIETVVAVVRDVLGDDAIGIYLYGSAVLGGLRPHSDLDLLVVASRATAEGEKRALIGRILPISGRGDPSGRSRSIELTILVQSEVRPWRYPPRVDFQYGDWLRGEFERGAIAPWEAPNPDVALLVTMALAADRPLFGPPPAAVLDAVPPADLIRAMVDGIPGLLEDIEPDTANVLLTFARIWLTVATGEIRPKDAAADWVLARLPPEHRAVLARARAVYLGGEEDRWDDLRSRVLPHAEHVIREIERLTSARPSTDERLAR